MNGKNLFTSPFSCVCRQTTGETQGPEIPPTRTPHPGIPGFTAKAAIGAVTV